MKKIEKAWKKIRTMDCVIHYLIAVANKINREGGEYGNE